MDIERLLERKIKPLAEKMDLNPASLKKGLKYLGKNRLLALRASKEFGGKEWEYEDYFAFTETLQSYSSALGFLQRQHQAAARFISQSSSEYLKTEWLLKMARGKRFVGVSVSHLRNPDSPRVTAVLSEEGWHLTGEVPWVSGYRLFDWLVVGFFLPDQEEEGMALIPFKKSKTLKVSKPLPTIALSSIQTVHLKFKEHIVPESCVFSIKPMGSYKQNTTIHEVHFVNLSALALGFKRELEGHHNDLYTKLCLQYETCREAFLQRSSTENVLFLYAEMHRIATQLCTLVRFMKQSVSLICPNSIERRYRELMLFAVIISDAQTREACLEQMISFKK